MWGDTQEQWVNFTELPLNSNCTVWIVEPGHSQETLKLLVSTGEPQNFRHKRTPIHVQHTGTSPNKWGEMHGDDFLGFQGLQGGSKWAFPLASNETFLCSYKSGNIVPLRPSTGLLMLWPWAVPWGISMLCLLNNSQMTLTVNVTSFVKPSGPCLLGKSQSVQPLSCPAWNARIYTFTLVSSSLWVFRARLGSWPLGPREWFEALSPAWGAPLPQSGDFVSSLCRQNWPRRVKSAVQNSHLFLLFYISSYWTQILCSDTPQSPSDPLVSGNKYSTLFS